MTFSRPLPEEITHHHGQARRGPRGGEPVSEHHHHPEPRARRGHLEEVVSLFGGQDDTTVAFSLHMMYLINSSCLVVTAECTR